MVSLAMALCYLLSLVTRYLLCVCICVQSTPANIAKKRSRQVKEGEPFDMVVQRACILEDALQRTTRPSFRSIVSLNK